MGACGGPAPRSLLIFSMLGLSLDDLMTKKGGARTRAETSLKTSAITQTY